MTKILLAGLIAATQLLGAAMAETATFEADAIGGPPRGWLLTMTGRGTPKWTVERDEDGGTVLFQAKGFQLDGP